MYSYRTMLRRRNANELDAPLQGERELRSPLSLPLAQIILIKDTPYTLLSAQIPYRSGINYLFPGASFYQEHILLSLADKGIHECVTQFLTFCDSVKTLPDHEKYNIIPCKLRDLVRQVFSETDHADFAPGCRWGDPSTPRLSVGMHNGQPVLPRQALALGYFIEGQSGVCRHKNLLAFMMLGEAVDAGLFPKGELYVIRAKVRGRGHVALGYKSESTGSFLLIDTTLKNMCAFLLSKIKHIIRAMKIWGFNRSNMLYDDSTVRYVLDIMVRYKINPNIKELCEEVDKDVLKEFLSNEIMQSERLSWLTNNLTMLEGEADFHQDMKMFLSLHFPDSLNVQKYCAPEKNEQDQQPAKKPKI